MKKTNKQTKQVATHTPGPWSVSTGNPYEVLNWSKETYMQLNVPLAIRQNLIGGGRWDEIAESEAAANARLISAAPELLEIVKRLVSVGVAGLTVNDFSEARAVIAKATTG